MLEEDDDDVHENGYLYDYIIKLQELEIIFPFFLIIMEYF